MFSYQCNFIVKFQDSFKQNFIFVSANPVELQLQIALRRLWQEVDSFEENGSGWVVDHLVQLDLHVVSHDPLRAGGNHLKLPLWLSSLNALRNIKNKGNDW